MNRVLDIFNDSPTPELFVKGYLSYLTQILGQMDVGQIARFIELLSDARDRGATLFFIGNGGSAATASHFVNDLTIGTRVKSKPYRALCLSDNVASVTAIANDVSYDDIFVLQLQAHLREGDVVIAISASGNSPNIVKAIQYANSQGVHTVGLTGFDGGKLKELAKSHVHVPSNKGEYGPVEDVHMVLDHVVHAYLSMSAAQENL